MKRILSAAAALLLVCSLAACAAAPVTEQTPAPTEAAATPTATPEPTPEPTPAPTPEPVFTEIALDQTLFSKEKVVIRVVGIRFSANYMTYIDLSVENTSTAAISLKLGGICLNDWQVDGALENAEQIAAGETRAASAVVRFVDDPNAVYQNITSLAGASLSLSVWNDATGEAIMQQKNFSITIPDASPAGDPSEGATLVYEDKSLAVYLQGIDGTLQHTRALLYKKPGAKWMSVMIDPVYAGYTNIVNRSYIVEEGKYRLLSLDGTEVMTRQNITALHQLDLYLSLKLFDGRLNRPVVASLIDPNVQETVMSAPDAGPVVYQSVLSYCILRNMGVTQFDDHEAILLDLENITQNYLKMLDITAYPSDPSILVDGTAYPLMTYCTNAYPATHGYLLLWPEGAPEGTLAGASSVSVCLKVSRINGGAF